MSKAKKKTTKKPATKAAPAAGAFKVGDRVKVKAGEWGNSKGNVETITPSAVWVRLDNDIRSGNAHPFDADNLRAL